MYRLMSAAAASHGRIGNRMTRLHGFQHVTFSLFGMERVDKILAIGSNVFGAERHL
jgi:hypothetical protein